MKALYNISNQPEENMSNNAQILILDNDESSLIILERILHSLAEVMPFAHEKDFINHIKEHPNPGLLIIDTNSHEFNGYDVINRLRQQGLIDDVPVCLVIKESLRDENYIHLSQVSDYIFKPFRLELVKNRVKSYLELKQIKDQLKDQIHWIENEVTKRLYDLQLTFDLSIDIVTQLVETRDSSDSKSISRTRQYYELIMRRLQMMDKYRTVIDEKYIIRTVKASPLHDIGKMGIPENILMKNDKLSSDEFDIIKTHTTIGYNTIKNVVDTSFLDDLLEKNVSNDSSEFFKEALNIAKYHHEYWDGSGYPDGLKTEQIPLSARVMAVVDVFDALTNKRVYKEAWSIEKTIQYIKSKSGTQFDPDVVKAFLFEVDSIRKIWESSRT